MFAARLDGEEFSESLSLLARIGIAATKMSKDGGCDAIRSHCLRVGPCGMWWQWRVPEISDS
eukprot:5680122-Pyramimonas_sp.AAC.1